MPGTRWCSQAGKRPPGLPVAAPAIAAPPGFYGWKTEAAAKRPRDCAAELATRPGDRPELPRPTGGKTTTVNPVDAAGSVLHLGLTMKTATVRDLRNQFPRVAAWIAEGEPVEITKAGKPFARLMPITPTPRKLVKPDIMARLKETWGDRVFSTQEVAAMRAAELEGEEG